MYAQKKDSQIVHKDGNNFLPIRAENSASFLAGMWYTADMPYLYIHTQFGLTVRDRLPAPLPELLNRQHAAYLCGLIGPDVYFFDRLPPPITRKHEKRTGNALHNAPAGRVFAALDPLVRGDEARTAYALGFLCHYALDAAAHPFVESGHRGLDHTRFEMALELPFCARVPMRAWAGERAPLYARSDPSGADETPAGPRSALQPPSAKNLPDGALPPVGRAVSAGAPLSAASPHRLFLAAVRDRSLLESLDALHVQLTEALFGRSVRGAYRRSFRNFDRVHRLLYDPTGRKQRVARGMERALFKKPGTFSGFLLSPPHTGAGDLFNETHRPWASPWQPERPRTESFFNLYEAALTEAETLLPLYADALRGDGGAGRALEALLEGGSMAHGKPVR